MSNLLLRRRKKTGGGNEPYALKFTNESSASCTIGISNVGSNTPVLYYSYDGVEGELWNYSSLTLVSGQSVYIWGDNPNGFSRTRSKYSQFTMTSGRRVSCEGSVMSLLGEDILTIPSAYCFYQLFYDCRSLVNAPELPATTLANNCYYSMFRECRSLVNAPELPATTLVYNCYYYMFSGCTSLVNAPELPATTLAKECYEYMFDNCISLVNAPELPATTLANGCYEYMFAYCISLVNAPELPATTLVYNCYSNMFYDCRSLVNAPELPATTLANNCYYSMFRECTSLVNAPELPATTLAERCYYYMFRGCRSLTYIKCFAEDLSTSYALSGWVEGVSSSGTFVKKAGVVWPRNVNGIPEGWTVIEV